MLFFEQVCRRALTCCGWSRGSLATIHVDSSLESSCATLTVNIAEIGDRIAALLAVWQRFFSQRSRRYIIWSLNAKTRYVTCVPLF